MGKFLDLTGKKFGRLVVIKRVGTSKKGGNAIWLCECSCGQQAVIQAPDLKNNHTQSCGCLQKQITSRRSTKHGQTKNKKMSLTYRSWQGMKTRCLNKNDPTYSNYGGRGISICDRWLKFENFFEDMGERPPGYELDRIDNNGNYCKLNCRWVTSKINNRNRRNNHLITHEYKTMCLSEWAERYDIDPDTLGARLHKLNWPIKKALTAPVRYQRGKTNV